MTKLLIWITCIVVLTVHWNEVIAFVPKILEIISTIIEGLK
jgi:hypothetical protein